MSEQAVQLACRDINEVLAERYGTTIRYRIEYRITRRYQGEPSRYKLLFVNIFDDTKRQRVIADEATWEVTMTALAVVWNTIDILPGHG